MKPIVESDMVFGEYKEDSLFCIENSELQKSCGENVKTVEFAILIDKRNLCFVEAKSTFPNPANRSADQKMKMKFEEYFQDITEKFEDSFQMVLSGILQHTDKLNGMGTEIKNIKNLSGIKINFILVVKKAEDVAWLAAPKAELEARLIKMRKIWNVDIKVLNEALAKKLGLIDNSLDGP